MGREPADMSAGRTASGVEELFAAHLTQDADRRQGALDLLSGEFAAGRCGVEPDVLDEWLDDLAGRSGLRPTAVVSQPPSHLGDLELQSDDDPSWVEVKAQTRKETFDAIREADWRRDATDALRLLRDQDAIFARYLPDWAKVAYGVAPAVELEGWSFSDLFIADLAGLFTPRLRIEAGVANAAQLGAFLARKRLLHVTQEGARLVVLSDLVPVVRWLDGAPVNAAFADNDETAVALKVTVGGNPGHGTTHFTYHVAYKKGTLGRHKLHEASFEGVHYLCSPAGAP